MVWKIIIIRNSNSFSFFLSSCDNDDKSYYLFNLSIMGNTDFRRATIELSLSLSNERGMNEKKNKEKRKKFGEYEKEEKRRKGPKETEKQI